MTNVDNTVLYTGVTDDIERRVAEHKNHTLKGFTDRYNVTKCVYVEEYGNINDAIMRETDCLDTKGILRLVQSIPDVVCSDYLRVNGVLGCVGFTR